MTGDPRPAGARRSIRAVARSLVPAVVVAATVLAPAPSAASRAAVAPSTSLRAPFTRETVRRGDVDTDPYHVEHVYEVQYRLKRLDLFRARPDGHFGPVTEAAVKDFQRQNGLAVTGIVDAATWRPLIRQSVRYHRGELLNSWFARGGAATTPTRTGTFRVYYRDIDHVSSTFGSAPMPYAQFFSGGQALHGSRLMMDPYVGHSHGCVNLWTEDAHQLWNLTSTKRLRVHVYGRWS
jgi:lipoprotein-anchoring transpeptidase ErfK/SrfK